MEHDPKFAAVAAAAAADSCLLDDETSPVDSLISSTSSVSDSCNEDEGDGIPITGIADKYVFITISKASKIILIKISGKDLTYHKINI